MYDDTTPDPVVSDSLLGREPYNLSGQPGTRAPHILLERNGTRFSTLDLFGQQIVLLAGADGEAWCAAGLRVANRLGIQLVARRIGGQAGLIDVNGCWHEAYGVTPSGVVLVCLDGRIGWRAQRIVEQPERAIEQALRSIQALPTTPWERSI